MKKIALIIMVVAAVVGCTPTSQKEKEAEKSSAQILFSNLKEISGTGILFGHQDDLAYGIGWKYVDGESDVKRTLGDYPALFGWELGGIELGNSVNLDSVPFHKMLEFSIWAHENGGVNTFSWHPFSAVNQAKSSWIVDEVVVKHILPGGSHHEVFIKHMDKLIEFFNKLKTADGESIPFIFRPWHEMDGGWFWWGKDLCSPDEIKALFRFTIEYMWQNGVTNFLVAYSPDRHFNTVEEYLTWYPGDDIVDIIGVDNYYDMRPGEGGLQDAILKLEIAAKYAHKTGKVAAFTETGSEKIPYDKWFTEYLGAALNATEWTRKITYAMVWRNHDITHFYMPHPEHNAASDARKFSVQEHIWLLNDWNSFLKK